MIRSSLLLLEKPLRLFVRTSKRGVVRLKERSPTKVKKVRNIGILAHIDAGKTTTTERMLYYSGLINSMGEVHHGNTVTDFMDQERDRGITITSAAITFNWLGNRINLVDTPGHIDFTMEVEQTLQVLDGAIVILDSSAGVEAQTLTVWRQADYYGIPRMIFLNKMDRKDADIDYCMKSIQSKLRGVVPLLVQLPVKDKSENLIGLVDLITMEKLIWSNKSDSANQGKEYFVKPLCVKADGLLWDIAMDARCSLVEKLADFDDTLAERIISDDSMESIPPEVIEASVSNATISQRGVPVLCGSAYRNTGIQPLMDAVVKFLPSPSQRLVTSSKAAIWKSFGSNLYAKVFKIMHHSQKGPLTFVRIYSGQLKKGQKIYNMRMQKLEPTGRLMIAYADDYTETEEVDCGNIAVISGLKETVTGDMITSSASMANEAKSYLMQVFGMDEEAVELEFGRGANVPDPVFFCSVEPASQAYQNALDRALSELVREDPSLRVSHNNETGQTVLGGMGELHLDIIKERIISEYKVDVDLGPLQIAYKEKIAGECKDTFNFSQMIGNSTHEVNLTMSLRHKSDNAREGDKRSKQKSSVPLILDKSPESAANTAAINIRHLQALRRGIEFALSHGPKLGCPVIDTEIVLHWFETKRGTSDTVITSSTTQAIQKLLKNAGTLLMEPMMQLEVVLDSEDTLRIIVADLSRRRLLQQEVEHRGNQVVVHAIAPLSELLGYSTDLRTLSSGTASFSMEFYNYQEMTAVDETAAIKSITGF
ncbi:ribosome-releasing factor 2, mitochondrial [Ischnura elegans]|uniref:ribosome-releasing factor 2, mitochondrial n=1 Tax=Ischnura elegans TaxID=197161 RepID=UPI001ED874BB|nr:ribosome-releasing factor 2, mitochondrial [Ischnura elegans]